MKPAMTTPAELLSLAMQDHRSGKLDQAEHRYRLVLEADPANAEALHLLGVLSSQRGRHDTAISFIRQALTVAPHVAVFHNNLGFAHQALGQWAEAASHYRQALQLHPGYAVAYANLGAVLQSDGKAEEAERSLRQAIQLQPGHAQAHTVLGNALADQGKLEEAVACHQQALRLQPNLVDAHVNLGSALFARCELDAADACFRQALRLQPDSIAALASLASVQLYQGKTDEAIACFREALRLKPDHAEIHHHLGSALLSQGKVEEALNCQRRALQLRPDYAEAHAELGKALADQFKTPEALIAFEASVRLKRTAAARIRAAITLPAIHRSIADLQEWRQRFTDNLRSLHETHLTLDVTKDRAMFPFYLAYHGLNDRDLNRGVAKLYVAPQEDHGAGSHLTGSAKKSSDKIRIGFISKHFCRHTIGLLMRGTIAQLSREKFAVTVLSTGRHADDTARWIEQHADNFVQVPSYLPAARRLIAQQCLDVLFYTDIGMDSMNYTLAMSRLAPVQCVTWGHPVTTGIDTIDYFISSEDLETGTSDEQYTERLVRLKSPAIYYYRPSPPALLKPRSFFGLPEGGALYACPQSLFKLHPEFDEILRAILRLDLKGNLVLIRAKHSHAEDLLRERFAKTIPDVLERIHFVPPLDHNDFLNLNAVADVMLDPIHFGGGNTSYEALALGVPVVTLPSTMLRGRITRALFQQMGMTDCVVQSSKEYIDLAVRLGTDADYRTHLSAKIKAASPVLFENPAGIRALEEFLQNAVARAN
jgi:protein O-GlcNAc transferase